ncbi:antibiotic acetyltransferase [Candidatus Parcubacteria bacterium]|nr:MAG: antibiotic acetyltransferase [Candidatus Parcubacteria bacterium]
MKIDRLIEKVRERLAERKRLKNLSFPLKRPVVKVGHGTYFNHATVYAWHEDDIFEVGSYCSIADDVVFLLGGEHFKDHVTTWPWYDFLDKAKGDRQLKNTSKGQVKVGNDVWVGHGALILSGVELATGTVVGAGAVVTKSTPPYAVVAGNPAKIIKFRFDQETIEGLLASRWWKMKPEELSKLYDLMDHPVEFYKRLITESA